MPTPSIISVVSDQLSLFPRRSSLALTINKNGGGEGSRGYPLPCHLAVNVGVSLALCPLLLLWAAVCLLHPPAIHLGGSEGVVVQVCGACGM